MAYEDIVPESNVLWGCTLNGNANYFGTLAVDSTTTNVIGTYVNDHPFDNTKQSLRITAPNSSSQTVRFTPATSQTNLIVPGGALNTIEFWFKYTLTSTNSVPSITSIFRIEVYDNVYGEVNHINIGFNGGTTFGSNAAGTFTFNHRSSTSNFNRTGGFYYAPNVWHCVHLEYHADSSPSRNRPYLYVNGLFDNCGSTAVTPITESRTGLKTFMFGGGTSGTMNHQIAEIRYFNRTLTAKEKLLRGQYGKGRQKGLQSVINSDNPSLLLKMDNQNTTSIPIEGVDSTAWGSVLKDDSNTSLTNGTIFTGTQFLVNQTGNRNKGWRFNHSSTGNAYIHGVTKERLKTLWRDPNQTITFEWFSTAPQYDSTVATNTQARIMSIGTVTGDGRITWNNGTTTASDTQTSAPGTHIPSSIEYWSGTAFITGQLSDLSPTGHSQNNYSQWHDGQWHHHVTVIRRINNALSVLYYFDGQLFRSRNFGANSSQQFNDWEINIAKWHFGASTGAAVNRTTTLDNFAIYNYELSANQILNHYYAFMEEDPAVKYYDGTAWQTSSAQKVWNGSAWIDWSKKYYDGTQWVNV